VGGGGGQYLFCDGSLQGRPVWVGAAKLQATAHGISSAGNFCIELATSYDNHSKYAWHAATTTLVYPRCLSGVHYVIFTP
jgi:prepilin-type processing-associated H-X9-DG protein